MWQQVQGSISMVAARNKDTLATLLQCVTISLLILFKWKRDVAPPPVQCLLVGGYLSLLGHPLIIPCSILAALMTEINRQRLGVLREVFGLCY